MADNDLKVIVKAKERDHGKRSMDFDNWRGGCPSGRDICALLERRGSDKAGGEKCRMQNAKCRMSSG